MSIDNLDDALARIDKLERMREEDRNEIKRVKRRAVTAEKERDIEKEVVALVQSNRHKDQAIPEWVLRLENKEDHATPVMVWSDFHFGEIQPPHEVGGYNAYSDKIAEMRLRHVTESSIKLLRKHTQDMYLDGIVIAGAGDYITGTIHDELEKTNSETVFETVVRWVPKMAAAIRMYADEFGKVFVPMVQGNHDRNTHKVETKRGPQECISWVLCHWLADCFENDDRVTFYIAPSWDTNFRIYDTNFMLTHGYGTPAGGPASAVSSMMKEKAKYDVRDSVIGGATDYLIMGHLHQNLWAPGAIMGGCLKGIDAYAWSLKVKPVPPTQALFLVTPEYGITTRWDVRADTKAEKKLWKKVAYGRNV